MGDWDGLKAGTYGTGGVAITNQFFPIATGGAAPQWPGQVSNAAFQLVWLLYPEGTFQFLDGGRLDLGVVHDSALRLDQSEKARGVCRGI